MVKKKKNMLAETGNTLFPDRILQDLLGDSPLCSPTYLLFVDKL